jgi:hypothetical protein
MRRQVAPNDQTLGLVAAKEAERDGFSARRYDPELVIVARRTAKPAGADQ